MRTWPFSNGSNCSFAPVSVLCSRSVTPLVSRKGLMVDRAAQRFQRACGVVVQHAHGPGNIVETPTQPVELAQLRIAAAHQPQVALARSESDSIPVDEHESVCGADDVAAVWLAVRKDQVDVARLHHSDNL